MSVTCKWPGCKSAEHRPWCDEHFRALPGHIRTMIANRWSEADREALAWIRVTFDADGGRGKWDPGKWERLVRSVRDRDAARARRRDAAPEPSEAT